MPTIISQSQPRVADFSRHHFFRRSAAFGSMRRTSPQIHLGKRHPRAGVRRETATLVYGATDEQHNDAVARLCYERPPSDAVRSELLTGLPTHGRFHSTKAQQYSNALAKWLENTPRALTRDRIVAQSLLDDLTSALLGM
jgi:hypothetical protein